MSEFDLRALIREVCNSSTITDPATLAKEVSRRIGRGQERAALEQALPLVVQHVVSRQRSSYVPPSPVASAAPERRPTPANRSWKVAGIREAWRRVLRDRIAVGPATSDWKFLGDCTVADLAYAASIREDHARRNAARAAQLRDLADLLTEHGAARVADLPDDALATTLEQAA